jgi:hypothetical protein
MVSLKEEKAIERAIYGRKILEAILVSAIEEEALKLPTLGQFAISELVNGVIDYVGGNSRKILYKDFRMFPRSNHSLDKEFVDELFKYFKEEVTPSRGKIDPKVKGILHFLVLPRSMTGDTIFYFNFESGVGGICPMVTTSTFSLPYTIVFKVKNDILPSLSRTERESVEGIGKSMRSYIKEDLEYINKNFHW